MQGYFVALKLEADANHILEKLGNFWEAFDAAFFTFGCSILWSFEGKSWRAYFLLHTFTEKVGALSWILLKDWNLRALLLA